MTYLAIASYCFTPISQPFQEVRRHKLFLENRECTGRIYISEQGINIQVSGPYDVMQSYKAWLEKDSPFSGMLFNIEHLSGNIFPRLTIKYRKQLVALDCDVDLSARGEYITPEAFCKALETEEPKCLIDVRNGYETAIGHFEGAQLPPIQLYRQFPAYAKSLTNHLAKDTPILMCCTGGIRCELFSSLLKRLGFEKIKQLQGGLLNYGKKVGDRHWRGKVFVFDDRLAIPITGNGDSKIISKCSCGTECDLYYNCANMRCNNLFITCPLCLNEKKGCCSNGCMQSNTLRPFDAREGNKPFRRKHLWQKERPLQECPSLCQQVNHGT